MNPFLFLDIDDVLNNRATRKRQKAGLIPGWTAEDHDGIDPENVVHLNAIVEGVSGLRVVLSSNWRHHYSPEEVTGFLRAAGYLGPDIREVTPSPMVVAWGGIATPTRGSQIREWLDIHVPGQTSGICVLDDIHGHEMRPVGRYLVQTAPRDGLRANHVSRARRLLGV